MTRRYKLAAVAFLCLGAATATLSAYFLEVSRGLENPLTHVFPVSFNHFAYVQYYYETEAYYNLFLGISAVSFGLAAVASTLPSIAERPALRSMAKPFGFLGGGSSRFRMTALAIPLVLMEAGFLLYGGLMGLARFDFQLSVALREELAVKALVFGPPALVGAASSSEQDYHFFCLFTALLATTHYRFGSLRRMIQLGALAILPLPTMIYLFDGIEFNTFFASAVDRAGMPWFSNAVLLYLSLSVFIAATAFPVASRVASRLARRVQHSFRQERDFQVED